MKITLTNVSGVAPTTNYFLRQLLGPNRIRGGIRYLQNIHLSLSKPFMIFFCPSDSGSALVLAGLFALGADGVATGLL
jgi:hypothetical protein